MSNAETEWVTPRRDRDIQRKDGLSQSICETRVPFLDKYKSEYQWMGLFNSAITRLVQFEICLRQLRVYRRYIFLTYYGRQTAILWPKNSTDWPLNKGFSCAPVPNSWILRLNEMCFCLSMSYTVCLDLSLSVRLSVGLSVAEDSEHATYGDWPCLVIW